CAYSYIVQIDVFVKYNDEYNARIIRNKISNRIQKLLWSELKMGNVSNGKPAYIEEYKTYRTSRVYEGIFYKEEN
ncbi:hypothetical protein L2V43_15540, partial [Staphylococcus aureus]|nr:hypothetical protein [Staphylococcus aureus]